MEIVPLVLAHQPSSRQGALDLPDHPAGGVVVVGDAARGPQQHPVHLARSGDRRGVLIGRFRAGVGGDHVAERVVGVPLGPGARLHAGDPAAGGQFVDPVAAQPVVDRGHLPSAR
ncbi:hypothetical protein [Amycolatopsis thailandensis]|uniref:hypothetical protein n=1 Tax=Amycolatopsis thailandensis TaxID=589330 RepID=UPI00363754E5